MEHLIRFLIGGVVVSVFAALGDVFRPRILAGMFGAAPTIALATLGLTIATKGAEVVSLEGRSMLIGAVALSAHSPLASYLLLKRDWSSLPAALLAWMAWFVISFSLWALLLKATS